MLISAMDNQVITSLAKEVMFLVALVCLFVCLFVTSLAKEVMFLVALVCLFVCLSVCLFVDNITQKVTNGLG